MYVDMLPTLVSMSPNGRSPSGHVLLAMNYQAFLLIWGSTVAHKASKPAQCDDPGALVVALSSNPAHATFLSTVQRYLQYTS